jgi:hypothetical protein
MDLNSLHEGHTEVTLPPSSALVSSVLTPFRFSTATLGAKLHFLPTTLPLLSPGKRTLTVLAHFSGKI